MTDKIVEKLHKHLAKPVNTECKVVYLLAEIRKLLDRDDPQHLRRALWMYCHWALHVDLGNPGTTREFLERVDLWVSNTVAYLNPYGTWGFLDEHHLFEDFLYLETFRRELASFLNGYGLATTLCDNDKRWYGFIAAYAGVIEDGTLSMNAGNNTVLAAVKTVTFTKGKTLSPKHHVSFVIKWDVDLKDGRTLETEVNTVPTKRVKMTAHHLHLITGNFTPPTPASQQPTVPLTR